jgi:hypothetical protein
VHPPASPRIVHGLSITEMDKARTAAGLAGGCTPPPFPNLVRGGVHPLASPWIVHGLSITEMDKGRTGAGLAGGCTPPPPFLIW